MRNSSDHILTSQAGSLPRPDDLIEANSARESGKTTDEAAFQKTLQAAVVDVVRKQKEIGIDVPGDGEFGKAMGHKVNYRAWWSYCFNRLGGLDLAGPGLYDTPPKPTKPGEVALTSFANRRDRNKFLPVYKEEVTTGPAMAKWPVCVGPVAYKGQEAIKADIAHFKRAESKRGL
jgi:5-methyltetrahydropteroyltriglutamate--homocysteine methyltransferase